VSWASKGQTFEVRSLCILVNYSKPGTATGDPELSGRIYRSPCAESTHHWLSGSRKLKMAKRSTGHRKKPRMIKFFNVLLSKNDSEWWVARGC
jgi:hypothetical protein